MFFFGRWRYITCTTSYLACAVQGFSLSKPISHRRFVPGCNIINHRFCIRCAYVDRYICVSMRSYWNAVSGPTGARGLRGPAITAHASKDEKWLCSVSACQNSKQLKGGIRIRPAHVGPAGLVSGVFAMSQLASSRDSGAGACVSKY